MVLVHSAATESQVHWKRLRMASPRPFSEVAPPLGTGGEPCAGGEVAGEPATARRSARARAAARRISGRGAAVPMGACCMGSLLGMGRPLGTTPGVIAGSGMQELAKERVRLRRRVASSTRAVEGFRHTCPVSDYSCRSEAWARIRRRRTSDATAMQDLALRVPEDLRVGSTAEHPPPPPLTSPHLTLSRALAMSTLCPLCFQERKHSGHNRRVRGGGPAGAGRGPGRGG